MPNIIMSYAVGFLSNLLLLKSGEKKSLEIKAELLTTFINLM